MLPMRYNIGMSSDVQFDSDFNPSAKPGARGAAPGRGPAASGEQRGMTGWLIRHGLAKSGSSANIVLVGVVLVNAIIILVVLRFL